MKWPWRKEKPFLAILPGNEIEPQFDPYSGTWQFVKAFLEAEIKKLHERNEKTVLDERSTAVLRGQIKMARALLSLGENGSVEIRTKTFAADIFGTEGR